MGMLRTATCDICKVRETESDYGIGWKGWCIIQGIAAQKPNPDEKLTQENMSMMLCPVCTLKLTDYLTNQQNIFIEGA